jgi:hypothetical protein
MQTSPTRLKKPLHLWLARIITLGIILASVGIGVYRLPEILDKLKHEGIERDVMWGFDQNGEAIIQDVALTAEQNGVAIGDKVLNYEDDTPGRLGTPVTLHIQRGSSPARDITFLRNDPADDVVFGGIQLGLPFDASVTMAFLLNLIPVMIGAVGALLLYWLRSNDWMALLTATVLAYFAIPIVPSTNPVIIIFSNLLGFLLFSWFLLFPNGKLMPRWSWAILLFMLLRIVELGLIRLDPLTWNKSLDLIDRIFTPLTYIALLALFAILYFRYRYTFSPVERQQGKWVITAVIIGFLPIMIISVISQIYWNTGQSEANAITNFFGGILIAALLVSLSLGIFFSIFRYRLYDVDTVISRAIVYSSLTGILALIGFMVVPLINYALTQSLGNQSGLLAVLVSALPIAALFNPVRERLQKAVEHRFKPEEMDFENTFIEFTSELRSLFTVKELSTLLARHAVKQLDIAHASVFLNGQNGQLNRIATIYSDQGPSDPSLDDKTLEKIRRGQLVSPDGDYAQSLVVPLVVPRSREPSLLGALVLGPRSQGVGYSTSMVKSLKKFGEEVGKAIYVAEMKSNKEQMLMENE